MHPALLALFGLLLLSAPSIASDFSGPVISVLDGDTIEVLHNNEAERLRLNGIDCPEKGPGIRHQGQARRLGPRLRQTAH